MKKTILLLLIPLFYFSCTQDKGTIDFASIKATVARNKHFIEYTKAQDELAKMALTGESSFSGVNRKAFQSEIRTVKTLEEAKAIARKAGIKGADKMTALLFQMNENLRDLVKDVPELTRLDRKQLNEVLKFQTSITDEDVKKSAERILSQDN